MPHSYSLKRLLAQKLNLPIGEVLFLDEKKLDQSTKDYLASCKVKLENGYPLDYILGTIEILGLSLRVDPNVLIPRPETEEWLLYLSETLSKEKSQSLLVDLGCGSGLIGLYLAQFFDQILLVDISPRALKVAKINAKQNKINNIKFWLSDGLSNSRLFNEIKIYQNWTLVANLPYLPIADQSKSNEYRVSNEPDLALYSGADGLDLFRRVVSQIEEFENPPSQMVFELDPRNINPALDLLQAKFENEYEWKIWTDGGGFQRTIFGQKKKGTRPFGDLQHAK